MFFKKSMWISSWIMSGKVLKLSLWRDEVRSPDAIPIFPGHVD